MNEMQIQNPRPYLAQTFYMNWTLALPQVPPSLHCNQTGLIAVILTHQVSLFSGTLYMSFTPADGNTLHPGMCMVLLLTLYHVSSQTFIKA